MDIKFPYEKIGKTAFGEIYHPVVKVTLKSPVIDKSVDIWMVVDTGADYTIIPRHFCEKLRISLEKDCFKDETMGVGGSQQVYFCKNKILATIGPHKREIPLAFLDNNEIPALLGRLGFLETFNVEFTKTHHTLFKD